RPCFKWKQYQTDRPSALDLHYWFNTWPSAGPALVLGPLSGVFAIDVDGKDAHRELVRRLGKVPIAPTVMSGSGDPYRYHLYFRHPAIPTKARDTPWHSKLEFRGHGGIIILPPALHKSGNHYRWASGKSLNDLCLAPLPPLVKEALNTKPVATVSQVAAQTSHNSKIAVTRGLSRATRRFLSGAYAASEGWNGRLFCAACDLAGNRFSLEHAIALLLAGARPWNEREKAKAIATIRSAYNSL